MKKLVYIISLILLLALLAACGAPEETTVESPPDENATEVFLSAQERESWKDGIIGVLSSYRFYEQFDRGCLGAALMDINFDNTPELFIEYEGGSMGNVCLLVYDIENGERLCSFGETPHYNEYNEAYFCVYRNKEGDLFIVNKGSIRIGTEWCSITSVLNDQFKFDSRFKEVTTANGGKRYYCGDNEVDRAEYEKQKNQFENDNKAIEETQIKFFNWNPIDANDESRAISIMVDALINSDQQFVNFGK